jgi:3D (Asp-Asp-Asp) domain-containing protein
VTPWRTAVRPRRAAIWAIGAVAAVGLAATHVHSANLTVVSPHGTVRRHFWTWDATWRTALRQAGVRVSPHDWESLSLTASPAKPLTIRLGVPVEVVTPHHRYRTWTTAYRVSAVLQTLGVELGPLDIVKPGLTARIRPGTLINVWRRWYVTQTRLVPIDFPTVYQPDGNMFVGHRALLALGRNGERLVVTRVLMQDGRPIRQWVVSTRVIRPPVAQLLAVGTKNTISRGGQVIQFAAELNMVATAYWPNPAWSDGYTATGLRAQYGVVAVDPAVIPLGTRLFIPGYGFAIAADTGSAIVGDRIDVCENTAQAAWDWGVRDVEVFLLP